VENANSERSPEKYVLMLHGWAQNAAVMRHGSKNLGKKLQKAGYTLAFLEGPHQLPTTSFVEIEGQRVEIENGKRENARSWFLYNKEDPSDASQSQAGERIEYYGLEESIAVVADAINTIPNGMPIHLLGFSQGAVFCQILAASRQRTPLNRIRSAILVSGFPASCTSCEELSDLALPSLHVIGSRDISVLPEKSLALAATFRDASFLRHDKGHTLPQQSAACTSMIEFLDRHSGQRLISL
jgi:pimeloyl-ACP methyl ester carboxylesterase